MIDDLENHRRLDAKRWHILVVEDETPTRLAIARGLERAGYRVSEAANRTSLFSLLHRPYNFDLITLDLELGHEGGPELAAMIRERTDVPIIMVTGRSSPQDRVTGLEAGADDYIGKPFLVRELLLRIDALLRKGGHAHTPGRPQPPKIYQCDIGIVDVAKRNYNPSMRKSPSLTDVELDILILFLRNPGTIMSRDDICLALRGRRWQPADRTIDGHIARLRKKIEPNVNRPSIIKTVRNAGYVFTSKVTPVE